MNERTYTFRNGKVVRLRKISQPMLSRLMVSNTDKIELPYKLVEVGTRKEQKLIPDYNNPIYVQLLEEQTNKDRAETLGNLAVFSVIDDIPEDEIDFYWEIAKATKGGEPDKNFVKSLWLLDQLDDSDELGEFQEAMLGINHITQRGVEASQEKFQGDN